jgi:TRAP-type C4-dicarboxylate transport system permease large subunit
LFQTVVSIGAFIRAITPYWLLLVALLLMVTFVPAISLALPNWVF